MGRKAAPRKWREWFVTEAGGTMHKLCPQSDGLKHAKQLLKDYLKQLDDERRETDAAGLVRTDGPYTIAHLAAEFLQYQEGIAGEKQHFQNNKRNLQRFVEWYGDVEARRLRLSHYGDYVSRLRELPGRKGKPFSGTAINHHLKAAKAVLNYGVDEACIVKNPWGRKAKLVKERQRKRIASQEEFDKLLSACERCIPYQGKVTKAEAVQMMREALYLLRYTALRTGEFRKLRGDHVHLDHDLIIIPPEEHKTGERPKEKKPRLSPILPEVKPMLKERKERYGDGNLFPNRYGNQWNASQFAKQFARLCEWAGIDEPDNNGETLVPYSLRHTRLTEAGIDEGWDVWSLMQLGGHTNPDMLKRYVHPDAEQLKRMAVQGRKRRLAEVDPIV